MASINFAGNIYSGEVLEDLLVYTAQGNDTYQEGLIHIKPGVQKKFTLPHVSLNKIIQDNVATPTTQGAGSDTNNQYSYSERYLEPSDFMVYVQFNPREFEDLWRPFQPEGPLVFRDLNPTVQAKMLHLLIDKKDQYLNDSIWCSKKGGVDDGAITTPTDGTKLGSDDAAGPMKYFDGFLARVLTNLKASAKESGSRSEVEKNEVASGEVILAGDTELTTGEQVEKALYAIWKKTPKKLRKKKGMKFVMSWELWDLYDEYLSAKDSKYSENTDENRHRFKGKTIKVIDGLPEHSIFFGNFTTEQDSCLWMAVDYATDQESVKVMPLQNNSEEWFFQMRMKVDINIALPGEIIVWTAYKNAG